MHFLRTHIARATCASLLLAVFFAPGAATDAPIGSNNVNKIHDCDATVDKVYNSTLESIYEQDYEFLHIALEQPLGGRSRISRGLNLDKRQCGTCPSGYSCCGTKKCCLTGNICVENYQVCCANDGSVPCGAVCCPKGEFCNGQAQCRASTTTVTAVATITGTSTLTQNYVVSQQAVVTNVKTEQSTSVVTITSAATATDWTTVTISRAPQRRARAVITPTSGGAAAPEEPVQTSIPEDELLDFEVNDSHANTCTQEHHILRKRQQQQSTVTRTASTNTQWVYVTVVASTTLRNTVTTDVTTTQWQTRTMVLNAATTVRSTTTTNVFRVQSVGASGSSASSPTGSSNPATDTGTPLNPGNSGLSTGTKAGIGAGLGGAALLAIAAFFLWRRSSNKNKLAPAAAPLPAGPNEPAQQTYYGTDKMSAVSTSYGPSSPQPQHFTPSQSPGPYIYEAPGEQGYSTQQAGYHEMGQGLPRQGQYHAVPPQEMYQHPPPQQMYQYPGPQEMGASPMQERGYRG
ncbi:hypothetical protein BKA63DRAFT_567848 [Paraphoma chrysanthemicola]|nr:hypothetical protein BKA63DRAFT_567848 [Paraphoma chrysanthemicola]